MIEQTPKETHQHRSAKALQVLRVLHKHERRDIVKEETEKQVKLLMELLDEAYKNWKEEERIEDLVPELTEEEEKQYEELCEKIDNQEEE